MNIIGYKIISTKSEKSPIVLYMHRPHHSSTISMEKENSKQRIMAWQWGGEFEEK